MSQSLELLLDAGSEAEVRRNWGALAAAGLPSMAGHTGESNRPHVTLTVQQHVPDDVERAFETLVSELPIDLTIGAPILFGAGPTRILCRLVVPSHQLLAFHRRADECLDDLPRAVHLRPDGWTPHVTLARRLPLADVGKALEILGELGEFTSQAVAVRRWDARARRTWLLG